MEQENLNNQETAQLGIGAVSTYMCVNTYVGHLILNDA
jgi:hypothetical protein